MDLVSAAFTEKLRNPTKIFTADSSLQKLPCKIGKPQAPLAELYKELDKCNPSELKYKYFVGLDRFAGMTSPLRRKMQAQLSAVDRQKLDDILLRLSCKTADAMRLQEQIWNRLLNDLNKNHDVSWHLIQNALQDGVADFSQLQNKIFTM